MKIALISTTINVPRVLALYRAFGPEVEIIVAGDRKTPHDETRALLGPLNARYAPSNIISVAACSAC